MEKLFETDYVLYDKANDMVVQFEESGDCIIYGSREEAEEDCYANEYIVKTTDLPLHWQKKILKQLKKSK